MGYSLRDKTESSFNRLYYDYIKRCRLKKITFKLSKDFFRHLTKQNCFYCGQKPKNKILNANARKPYIFNGIDRLDNTRGYTKGNVVACCKQCNYMKFNYPFLKFLKKINMIHRNLKLNDKT